MNPLPRLPGAAAAARTGSGRSVRAVAAPGRRWAPAVAPGPVQGLLRRPARPPDAGGAGQRDQALPAGFGFALQPFAKRGGRDAHRPRKRSALGQCARISAGARQRPLCPPGFHVPPPAESMILLTRDIFYRPSIVGDTFTAAFRRLCSIAGTFKQFSKENRGSKMDSRHNPARGDPVPIGIQPTSWRR